MRLKSSRVLRFRSAVWSYLSGWLPWLCIGVILILVYYGIGDILVMAASTHESGALTAAELKDRIDELKWILGLIVTTAGLFTVAQSVAAGFNARSFTEQAERMLEETRARFKILPLLEGLYSDAFANLANLERTLASNSPVNSPDEGFNWQRRFYEKMPLKLRQELSSADQIIPYEVVGQSDLPDAYTRNLRRLAKFYWSKFIFERERGAGYLGDLERAEYLLDLAMRKIGSAFYLLNDTGNILIEFYKVHAKSLPPEPTRFDKAELEKTLQRARRSFEDSIAVEKRQLRAYFNLAFIETRPGAAAAREENLRAAIGFLKKGLDYPNWEREPVDEFRCSALYNLGCYYARLAAFDPAAEGSCIEVLRKAAALGLISPQDVEHDFTAPDGDFYKLMQAATPERRSLFAELQDQLPANYPRA